MEMEWYWLGWVGLFIFSNNQKLCHPLSIIMFKITLMKKGFTRCGLLED